MNVALLVMASTLLASTIPATIIGVFLMAERNGALPQRIKIRAPWKYSSQAQLAIAFTTTGLALYGQLTAQTGPNLLILAYAASSFARCFVLFANADRLITAHIYSTTLSSE